MEFRTQYTPQVRKITNPGNPIKKTYGGSYDVNGRLVLTEKGQENIYDFIQSHKDSVDIHVLLKRYQNGDVSALSKVQGMYMDITGFPTNYAEALNHMRSMEEAFMQLPVDKRAEFNHSFSEFLAASTKENFLARLGVKVQESDNEPIPAIPVDNVKEVAE